MREAKNSIRNCKHCGSLLTRKRNESGRLEDFTAFNRRKFCGHDCYGASGSGRRYGAKL